MKELTPNQISDPTFKIENAALIWDETGQPSSSLFGDVYFSCVNGLLETRHVFLQHNQLAERFSLLKKGEFFTIGETGFGSGLNFLAACELFLQTAPKDSRLHFISAEKFPLKPQDLTRALALWPELNHLSSELIRAYPCIASKGFYRLNLFDQRIHLTLVVDDAAAGFEQLLASDHPNFKDQGCKIDAWFLDGFAPSKNPEMWSDELFDAIAFLSHTGTTAATFSAAGIVKKGLRRAGFNLQKVPGFGKKREMIKAFFKTDSDDELLLNIDTPTSHQQLNNARYALRNFKSSMPYTSPWHVNLNASSRTYSAIIVGAGISGCHTARALAERGWKVCVIDKHSVAAQGASGNPQGMVYAKLSHKQEVQAAFNEAALQFSLSFYEKYWPHIGEQCGLIQLATDEKETLLHEQLREKYSGFDNLVEFIDAEKASLLIGSNTPYRGVYFKRAGWINPFALCQHLLDHPNIEFVPNHEITQLHHLDGQWHLQSQQKLFLSKNVVLSTAEATHQFLEKGTCPTKAIRGQITYFSETDTTPNLKTVVCGKGYIAPAAHGIYTTGATFNLHEKNLELTKEDQQANVDNLKDVLPEFDFPPSDETHQTIKGRAAFRCSLPDYLPMVGAVADAKAMKVRFDKLRKNAQAPLHESGIYLDGLFVNIGQGSRGLAYTPLCAELLASMMNNEPLPVARELAIALNPARFLIRDLIRNKA